MTLYYMGIVFTCSLLLKVTSTRQFSYHKLPRQQLPLHESASPGATGVAASAEVVGGSTTTCSFSTVDGLAS